MFRSATRWVRSNSPQHSKRKCWTQLASSTLHRSITVVVPGSTIGYSGDRIPSDARPGAMQLQFRHPTIPHHASFSIVQDGDDRRTPVAGRQVCMVTSRENKSSEGPNPRRPQTHPRRAQPLPTRRTTVCSLDACPLQGTDPIRVESTTGAVAVGKGGSCCRWLSPIPVPHSSPWLRFQSPLIEPDMQISRIRLSDEIMPSPTESSPYAAQDA